MGVSSHATLLCAILAYAGAFSPAPLLRGLGVAPAYGLRGLSQPTLVPSTCSFPHTATLNSPGRKPDMSMRIGLGVRSVTPLSLATHTFFPDQPLASARLPHLPGGSGRIQSQVGSRLNSVILRAKKHEEADFEEEEEEQEEV